MSAVDHFLALLPPSLLPPTSPSSLPSPSPSLPSPSLHLPSLPLFHGNSLEMWSLCHTILGDETCA